MQPRRRFHPHMSWYRRQGGRASPGVRTRGELCLRRSPDNQGVTLVAPWRACGFSSAARFPDLDTPRAGHRSLSSTRRNGIGASRDATSDKTHTNRQWVPQRLSGNQPGGCLYNEGRFGSVAERSCRRSPGRGLLSLVALSTLVAHAACGFGRYDDSAAPQVTSATDGVADAGQWWPWVCPDGDNPSPPSTPLDYTASGLCGEGGAFTLSVNGCVIIGTWAVLGLSDVQTLQPTSTPNLGGWVVSGTPSTADGGVFVGDGGAVTWNCEATPASDGGLTFTCSDATSLATTCQSSLTPAGVQ
jgi:hypothetical protein